MNKVNLGLSIGVMGAGWLGGSVGRALALAGHEVVFASRHPNQLVRLAEGLSKASVGTLEDAAACNVILLATPFSALQGIADTYGSKIAGRIVIDATNPAGQSAEGREGERIGVAELTRRMFPDTRLVRCFSAVDATCIEQGHGYGERQPLGVPLASHDAGALMAVSQLVRDAGCVPVSTGALDTARLFQRGSDAFRANTNAGALRDLMTRAAAA